MFMEKFKKFIKKPLLIISCCILALCSLGLIILSNQPKSFDSYEYEVSFMGFSMSMEIEFEDDLMVVTVESMGVEETETSDYFIKNGKLFVKNDETLEYTEAGTINVYEIKMKVPVDDTDLSLGYMTVTYKCESTNAIRTMSIVMMVVSILGIATSIIYTKYEKSHPAKSQDEQQI